MKIKRGQPTTDIINPFGDADELSWWLTQNIYGIDGVSRAVKSGEGSGNIPKVLIEYED